MELYVVAIWILLPSGTSTLSCDFEKGLCGWLQSKNDQFDWRTGSGLSPESTSGPNFDHTNGYGNYIYISGRDDHGPQSLAILTSPPLYLTSQLNFSFWYHMNGIGVGNLSLLATEVFGQKKTLWYKNGRQGPDWQYALIKLPLSTVQLEFQASAKYYYDAIIAVDDVTASYEPDVTHTSTSIPTSGGSPAYTGIFPDCDFDTSFCLWKQSTSNMIKWHRVQGSSADYTSGPDGDHTSGSGHYLLLLGHEARNLTWFANMFSPLINVHYITTMTFWYHMNGIGVGHLSVIRRTENGLDTVIWTRQGRQGPDWLKADVTLQPGRYQLTFEAAAKFRYGSDLAVDDILFDHHPII